MGTTNHAAKPGRVRVFKKHSVSTRLPRKEREIRKQLYRAVAEALSAPPVPELSQDEAFDRGVKQGMFKGLSAKGEAA